MNKQEVEIMVLRGKLLRALNRLYVADLVRFAKENLQVGVR
jgi:hypothetical protein